MTKRRVVVRIALRIAQLGLAVATVAGWSRAGLSRGVIALAALTAAEPLRASSCFATKDDAGSCEQQLRACDREDAR